MAKKRVYQVAKEFRISSEALIGMLQKLGYDISSHMNAIDEETIEAARAEFEKEKDAVKREYAKKIKKAIRKKKGKGALKVKKTPTKEKRRVAETLPPKKEAAKPEPKVPEPPKKPKVDRKKIVAEAARQAARDVLAKQREERAAKKAAEKKRLAEEKRRREEEKRAAQERAAREAEEAKREREKKEKAPEKEKKGAAPAKREKKPRKGRGDRRRKRRPRVDQKTVEETVRKTMAASGERRTRRRKKRDRGDGTVADDERAIQIPEFASVGEFAEQVEMPVNDVIKKCLDLGLMVTINQRLDADTIQLLAEEVDADVELMREYGEDILEQDLEEATSEEDVETAPRAPVVVVMGHVDHGKTLLLDYIRSTNVVGGESGGITQHIGAYEVEYEGERVTFLDTPGHEAFTAMRARGAQATDVVVLVVAADDGVMPQTLEAIDHAKAAGVPIIVAVNKIDLPGANPDKVRSELAQHGLTVEEWGGETVAVETSAKTGQGVDKLLEMILFQSGLLELKAVDSGPGRGVVIEVEKERGRGIVATVLVESGTLRVGDPFVVGLADGKVRSMHDEFNNEVEEAGPSKPVQISGLTGVPQAGDVLAVVSDERLARDISGKRRQQQWERQTRFQHRVTLEDLHDQILEGQVKELRIIIKGDVDGSIGALADSLERLSTEEVKVEVIRKAVGAVTESDVLLAAASNAIIVGFHIGASVRVRDLARREQVEIRLYKIIYEAVEDIRAAMEGLLEPERREVVIGTAEVRETFKVPNKGTIAGCYVLSGVIRRGAKTRVIRDEMLHHEGTVESLKRFKDDVREVQQGFECGVGIAGLDDIETGDRIEVYEIEEVARKLADSK
ncbi:MAG: translation initiation factor IF-2 [Candidatus Eisenbacteria bacterium]|nr:translation initiation factor IF-2 [Candidatus Eisenbacteria bacterium]